MALIPQNLDKDNEVTVETREASPSHFLFRIESFSLLSENGILKYESIIFSAGDYKWRLVLYPNGQEDGNDKDDVAVYLAIADTDSLPTRWEVNAIFSIFLRNQKSDNFLSMRGRARRFDAVNTKWGFPKFISKKSFLDQSNGYLVNDNCIFGAEVFVIKSEGVVVPVQCLSIFKDGNTYIRRFRISQFSKLEKKWHSEEFHAQDHKWKINVYPRGINDSKDRDISIFLDLVDCNHSPFREVKANCTFKVIDQINGKHCIESYNYRWFTKGEDWGFPKFMSITDMNDPTKGFLVEDCCILEVEISIQAVSHSLTT